MLWLSMRSIKFITNLFVPDSLFNSAALDSNQNFTIGARQIHLIRNLSRCGDYPKMSQFWKTISPMKLVHCGISSFKL